jgi:translation initiation factor IF-2
MSDSNQTPDKPAGARKPLSLKGAKVGGGTVRQNISHGRSKAVVVEKRRKRIVAPKGGAAKPAAAKKAVKPAEKPVAATPPVVEPVAVPPGHTLTSKEQEARARALQTAKQSADADSRASAERFEEEARLDAEMVAKREADEERQVAEKAEAVKRVADEKKISAEEEARLEAERIATAEAALSVSDDDGSHIRKQQRPEDNELGGRVKKKVTPPKQTTRTRGEPQRRRGKLTIQTALDDRERTRSLAATKRRREKERRAQLGLDGTPEKVVREVVIPESITVRELADRMATRAVEVIKVLMKQGTMAQVEDVIDSDTAQLIAEEFGHSVRRVAESDVEEGLKDFEEKAEDLLPRAPVVTVMGHVDHGKTSLLDALRQADVVAGEAGGITQHIGAYQVVLASGARISFLDTPGHAAFTAMRARGAKVTDIVVLVVAADDSVMPQTVEAINHARAAEVPIIIAINKMDVEGANPDRVRQDLLQHEIVVEEMGGDIQTVEVSAITKQGLDKLEEAIMLQTEILELKANPNRPAIGSVVEAKLDKGRGPVATVLIQKGTLRIGDIFVSGKEYGRVRALINDRGQGIDEAGPAIPVEVLGLNATPLAGDDFVVVETEGRAREIAEYRQRKEKEERVDAQTTKRGSLEQMLDQLKENETAEVPILIRADVQGSVEAIIGAVDGLGTDEVRARAIHAAPGGITESDVILAKASNAPIIGFNVRANTQARDMARQEGVEIRYYSVIYDLVDDIKAAMSGLLSPTLRETFHGNAKILDVFNITRVGKVAGCQVTEGSVRRGAKVRLIRDSVVIHEGTLSTLKRFKDEVREVSGGQECGMAFENYQDLQKDDIIECFDIEEIARTL